jgi:hypothetical protein
LSLAASPTDSKNKCGHLSPILEGMATFAHASRRIVKEGLPKSGESVVPYLVSPAVFKLTLREANT